MILNLYTDLEAEFVEKAIQVVMGLHAEVDMKRGHCVNRNIHAMGVILEQRIVEVRRANRGAQ